MFSVAQLHILFIIPVGIVRLVAGIELILFTIEWVFVSQLYSSEQE